VLLDIWGVGIAGLWTFLVSVITLIGVGFLATWTMVSNVTASLFLGLSYVHGTDQAPVRSAHRRGELGGTFLHDGPMVAEHVEPARVGRAVSAGLRLPGHQRTRGILGDGFEHLAGEEHQRGFDDRKQQRKEHRRDQGEFNGGRTPAVAAKSAQ